MTIQFSWQGMAAPPGAGIVEPIGVVASTPRNRRTMPNERWCKVEISQPRLKHSGGA
jgi:hypothetical protein